MDNSRKVPEDWNGGRGGPSVTARAGAGVTERELEAKLRSEASFRLPDGQVQGHALR
jgi:hypothetical protein